MKDFLLCNNECELICISLDVQNFFHSCMTHITYMTTLKFAVTPPYAKIIMQKNLRIKEMFIFMFVFVLNLSEKQLD